MKKIQLEFGNVRRVWRVPTLRRMVAGAAENQPTTGNDGSGLGS